MDTGGENQSTSDTMQQSPSSNSPEVGFPISQPKPKGKFNKWILIVILLLALTGGGVYLFTRSTGQGGGSPTPTPQVSGVSTSTPGATATSAPVDKSKVKIEVQNGTGITGEAAYLQGQLRTLGYTSVTVGNASSQDHSDTEVTFNKSLSSQVVAEITEKLESIYKKVNTKTSSTSTNDIVVITGLRKGATAKPSATATPKVTATPKASPTGSPTSSPTSSPSPTPSPTP